MRKHILIVNTSILLLMLLASTVFSQENETVKPQNEKVKSQVAPEEKNNKEKTAETSEKTSSEETPKIKENKQKIKVSPTIENPTKISPEPLPTLDPNIPQPNSRELPPDFVPYPYMEELEKLQKEEKRNKSKLKNKNAENNQQLEPFTDENINVNSNQFNQNPLQQLDKLAEEQAKKEEVERKQEEEKRTATMANMSKWFWLLPLFELLQTIGLSVIAFKKQIAKKSSMAMIIGASLMSIVAVIVSILFGVLSLTQSANNQLLAMGSGLLTTAIAIIGFYIFIIGKMSTYIIISFLPKSLGLRILSVFGIGFFLMALYMPLYSKVKPLPLVVV
jgi:hypothetical protein